MDGVVTMAETSPETFGEVRARLDEIVSQVRSKDVSLEKSLDLYEEAIRLGNRAAELIDKPDWTQSEVEAEVERAITPRLRSPGQTRSSRPAKKRAPKSRSDGEE